MSISPSCQRRTRRAGSRSRMNRFWIRLVEEGAEHPLQVLGRCPAHQSRRLIETFSEADAPGWLRFSERARVSLARVFRVSGRVGLAHCATRIRSCHLALVEHASTLDEGAGTEGFRQCFVHGLEPVAHKRQAALGAKPAFDQIGEQRLARHRVFGRSFPQPSRCYPPPAHNQRTLHMPRARLFPLGQMRVRLPAE